jgi:hypothetical protein
MLFEQAVPAGTKSWFHLHHNSDEVAWVLEGEFSFKIGDVESEGGPGTCAFMPRDVPHAWKNSAAHRAACCSSTRLPSPVASSRGCWKGQRARRNGTSSSRSTAGNCSVRIRSEQANALC